MKSEEGREKLKKLTEKFEKTFEPDSDDDESNTISDKDVVLTKLPWADLEREDDKNSCEKEIKMLAKKEDLLMKLTPHLKYQFDFDMEKYSFLAIVMTTMDKNLREIYVRLVPDEVSEAEFWRNFFYHIELWRMSKGFSNRLGE